MSLSRLRLASALWLLAVVAGHAALWRFATAPGPAGAHPSRWPAASALPRAQGAATLLAFLHPRCPCSHATLVELEAVLARAGCAVQACVVFARPAGVRAGWERGPLFAEASGLRGVTVRVDAEEAEARLFGAATSGQVLLYAADGTLRYAGGLTRSRGHVGANAGADAALAALTQDRAMPGHETFGCPLDGGSR